MPRQEKQKNQVTELGVKSKIVTFDTSVSYTEFTNQPKTLTHSKIQSYLQNGSFKQMHICKNVM